MNLEIVSLRKEKMDTTIECPRHFYDTNRCRPDLVSGLHDLLNRKEQ